MSDLKITDSCRRTIHIIEVGENMDRVVKRFLDGGLSVEETAKYMDVPEAYVRESVARSQKIIHS